MLNQLIRRSISLSCVLAALLVLSWTRRAAADGVVTYTAVADTSIRTGQEVSNGKGLMMVVGRTLIGTGNQDGSVRRGLFRFDLSTSCHDDNPVGGGVNHCPIPQNSTVKSARVHLSMTKGKINSAFVFRLWRITQAWGQGASVATTGVLQPAAPNDATWTKAFFPGTSWTAGGARAGAASHSESFASLLSNSNPLRSFPQNASQVSAGLVADVQAWVNDSTTNFGWMLTSDETTQQSLTWFGSVESASPPKLEIVYEAPQGTKCNANDDCATGFCVDTRCCQSASCAGGTTCRDAGSCNNAAGVCVGANKPDGVNAGCDDSKPCTTDRCQSGVCAHPADRGGTTCNASSGVCDPAETCVNGNSNCPADVKASAGTACADDGKPCTRDICDGSSASCTHPPGNAGVECKAKSGDCDVRETCDGSSPNCPADGVAAQGTECRAPSCQSSSVAVLPAVCDGSAKSCPASATQSCGALICTSNACPGSCTQDSQCASGNYCAAPTCQPKKPPGGSCSAANECTSGFCVDGTCCNSACGGNNTSDCQSCSTGTCTLSTGSCRAASGACDVAESCSGSSASCPADAVAGSGTVCQAASCSNGIETKQASCPGGGNKQCPALVQNACSPYTCGATACRTSCTSSSECVSSHYCSGNQCVPRVPRGGACAATGQCQSGLSCADGLCCNQACTGQCQACDINPGTCTTVPSGAPHGTRPPCGNDGSLCGGSCNGSVTTSCFYPGASTECIPASCSSGVETLRSVCDASGKCNPKQTADCSPFSCGPSACFGNCSDNVQCESGKYCRGGNCVPKLDDGAACSSSSQCSSTNCVDGVCCDKPCEGQCEACNVPGTEGECAPATGDPVGGRPQCVTDGSLCGGVCDGKLRTSCAYLGAGTSCRADSCDDGVAIIGAFCNGAGTCPPEVQQDCGPVGCNDKGTRCAGDCVVNNDCPLNQVCSAGICRAKGGSGAACAEDEACIGGICTDGVCCNSACQGQCEACDLPGKEGICTPNPGAPRGTRMPCASDGSSCAGVCDGNQRAVCAYPDSETSCGAAAACSAGIARLPSFCVGSGACPANLSQVCPAACSGTRCAGGCANDAACGAGKFCSAGVCIDKLQLSSGCSLDSQCASGFCVEGVCCEKACDEQCFSCVVPNSRGYCVPVQGAPRGGREPCQGEGPCAAQCDGTLNGVCKYPTEEVFCGVGSCNGNVASGLAVCSGAGSCLAPAKVDCFPYQCDGAACFVDCQLDEECQPGFHCEASSCLPDAVSPEGGAPSVGGAPGGAGEAPVSPSEGGQGPASGGAPSEMPSSAAGEPGDVTPGAAGATDGSAGSSGSKDSGGCGCRVPVSSGPSWPAVVSLALGLSLSLLRRRRASSRQSGLRDAA